MKRQIGSIALWFLTLSVISCLVAAAAEAAGGRPGRIRKAPAFATLSEALAGAARANGVLLVESPLRVEGEVTVPRGRQLRLVGSGALRFSEGSRLIVDGRFTAPRSRVFEGDAEVLFGRDAVREAYPEWWGSGPEASQQAVDAAGRVRWSRGERYQVRDIAVPSQRELIVDGTLMLADNSPDGAVIFRNADPAGGNRDIRITGDGTLDGNKSAQSGSGTKHMLVSITNCSNVEFAVKKVRGNHFPRAISSKYTGAAIFVSNSRQVHLHDSTGYDYGRECYWLKDCSNSVMRNLSAIGGDDSWSGFQFSGDNNVAENLYSENAGASGISFDCRNSSISNVTVKNNRFFNGINFGHQGAPAVNVTGRRLISHNSSQFGISVVNGSREVKLVDSEVHNAASHCYNVSANANNVSITRSVASGCAGNGVTAYEADVTVEESRISGSQNYGISADGGTVTSRNNRMLSNRKGDVTQRRAGRVRN